MVPRAENRIFGVDVVRTGGQRVVDGSMWVIRFGDVRRDGGRVRARREMAWMGENGGDEERRVERMLRPWGVGVSYCDLMNDWGTELR